MNDSANITDAMLTNSRKSSICPRCGYDLRGTIETWAEQCPLNGICTECGLDFQWAELLSNKVRKPKWCVEYAPSSWGVPWRCVKTLVMTAWPWGFWKSLKMSHKPNWRRIAIYLSLHLAVIYGVFAIGHGSVALHEWFVYRNGILLQHYVPFDARRGPKQVGNYAANTSAVWTTAQAILLPWSKTPPGKMPLTSKPATGNEVNSVIYVEYLSDGTLPPLPASLDHRPPIELFKIYTILQTWKQGFSSRLGLPIPNPMLIMNVFPIIVGTLCIAFFALLPQTRRKSKVRWEHLLRVGAYSVPLLVLPTIYSIVSKVIRFYIGWRVNDFVELWANLVFIFIPAALVVWWWLAAKRYLHMPHAFGVAAAAVSCAYLMTQMCGYFLVVAKLQVALQ